MTSRTSCCNGTLFHKTLRRFWPLWVAYLLLWLLVLPLGLHNGVNYTVDATTHRALMEETIYRVTRYGSLILTFGMAPLAAMAVFSGMYESKRAGVFASLPIRRESAFCALTLAGLVPLLAVPLLAAALAALVALSNACFAWTPFLTFLGITALDTITFYGFAVLCAQLTGQLLIVPAVYVVLEFTAPLLELLIRALLALFVYGYEDVAVNYGTYLSPFAAIIRHSEMQAVWEGEKTVGWVFSGWGVATVCAVSGLALLGAALLLYRGRRTETAGDTVALRPLRKVFSFALGIGCALVLSVLLADFFFSAENLMENRVPVVAAGFLLGGSAGYFGAEMLMRKSFRVFGACRRGGLILFAGLALLLAAMQYDVLGIERKLPAAESVQSVELHTAQGEAVLQDPGNIEKVLALNEYLLDHRAKEKNVSGYLNICYKCGKREIPRVYHHLPDAYDDPTEGAEVARKLEELYNCDEALKSRFPRDADKRDFRYTAVESWESDGPNGRVGDRSLEISAEEAYEWYTTCILPDVEDGTLGHIFFESEREPRSYNAECWMEIYRDIPPERAGYTEEAFRSVLIQPNVQSRRTNAWLEAHGVELHLTPER